MKRTLLTLTFVLLPLAAAAQTSVTSDPRYFVLGGVGLGTTWDDEGLLGHGPGVAVGMGVRLAPRLAIVGVVDRVGYYRDVEYLTFDGRVVFAGAELSFQFSGGGTGPYVTLGAGMLNDSGIWIRKNQSGPLLPITEERIERSGTAGAMTTSAGLAFELSRRMTLRTGLRLHGLLQTGDDLFPHVVIQPTAGLMVRF